MSINPLLFLIFFLGSSGCLFFGSTETPNNGTTSNNGTTANNGTTTNNRTTTNNATTGGPICGNGEREKGEQCDGTDLGEGITCLDDQPFGEASCQSCKLVSGCNDRGFIALNARGNNVCGLRMDGTVSCHGDATNPAAAGVTFSKISVASSVVCGIKKSDASILCWNADDGMMRSNINTDRYSDLSVGVNELCAISEIGGDIKCFGFNGTEKLDFFENVPTANKISMGPGFVCGLKGDEEIECWGGKTFSITRKFSDLVAGMRGTDMPFVCGISAVEDNEGIIECEGIPAPQATSAVQIEASVSGLCWVKSDGGVNCFGGKLQDNIPENTDFLQVAPGFQFACGVKTDGTIECWGEAPPLLEEP